MFEFHPSASIPQFLTAEYLGVVPRDHCHVCGELIARSYFRVGPQMACRRCAEKAGFREQPQVQENFGHTLLHGSAAALVGMGACAIVSWLTGWTIPVLAVAIGYVVARSVKAAPPELNTARYAVTASLLTYLAVAIGTLPALVKHGLVPSIADLKGGERALAWGLVALVSPFVQFAQADNGVFALMLLAAGMLFAAKQTISDKPQLIIGPFPQGSPR